MAELTQQRAKTVEKHKAVPAYVVHEAIRRSGQEELERPVVALAWSGLAAGLSMGFSLLAEALLRSRLPDAPWRPLITKLGYSVGFLIVIMGRQQLFTENTLTAVIPFLSQRSKRGFLAVMKLWSVVLAMNLVGAHVFAWTAANTSAFNPDIQNAMRDIAIEAGSVTFGNAVLRGVFAGWLIALIVWLIAATESSHIPIIVILTYVVGLASLTHIIAGSVEVLFLVMSGMKTWGSFAAGYMLPTLIGNILGGVSLVSALNHAQVKAGQEE